MSSEQGPRLQSPARLIDETWFSMEQARREVVENDGICDEQTHAWLEREVQEMYHHLRPKARLVEETWVQYQLDEIPNLCARKVPARESADGHFGQSDNQDDYRIERAPVDTLLTWVNGFRDCLEQLQWDLTARVNTGGGRLTAEDIHEAQFGSLGEFKNTAFAQSVIKDIEGKREGGAIIIVDAEDARTGVGKTSAAVAFAKYFSNLFGYELQEEDLQLSGQNLLKRYEEQPGEEQVSVAVWDEAVGAGSGDARRAMASENVDLSQAWTVMRQERNVTFVTLPDWGELDPRLRNLSDYRLWCRRDIGEVNAYEVGTNFQSGGTVTRGLGPGDGAEPIAFPDMKSIGDPHYLALKEKKDELIASGTFDADSVHGEDEADVEPEDTGPDVHAISDDVAENVDRYVSINPTNDQRYIDQDLIEAESSWDLTQKQAKQVRKLAIKKAGEI